jgi:hypothetical protein
VQHLGLFGVLRHAIHFGLQFLSSNLLVPVILQRLRLAQIICDLLFQLRLRHHLIERRLGVRTLLWPDAVTPVNVFDRSLISYALCKPERSVGNVGWTFRPKESQQCPGRQ